MAALKTGDNELVATVHSQFAEIARIQFDRVLEWGSNERQSSERHLAMEILSAEEDVEFQRNLSRERLREMIMWKYGQLIELMPGAAQYFVERRLPFIEELLKDAPEVQKKEKVKERDVPVLEDDFKMNDDERVYSVVGDRELIAGSDHFKVGGRALLQMGELKPALGTVTMISPSVIEFAVVGEPPAPILLTNLNCGLAAIMKA
jgi:hypothetical protein